MSREKCLSLIFLLVSLISGCGTVTSKWNISPQFSPPPQTVKSQFNIGIYYSPQFAEREDTRIYKFDAFTSLAKVVPIGKTSVKLFDDILGSIFEKRTPITKLSEEEVTSKGVAIVIAPSIEYFNFRMGTDKDSDWYSVCYRVTFYTKRIVPVASWVKCGNAVTNIWVSWAGVWIENDMIDAAIQIQKKLESDIGTTLPIIANQRELTISTLNQADIMLGARQVALSGFDAKQLASLQQEGVVAIQVTARSNIERQFVVRASDMRLHFKGDLIAEPLSIGDMLNVLGVESGAGDVGVPIGVSGIPSPIALPFALFSFLITANELYRESKLEWSVREKAFATPDRLLFLERTLVKGKEETGVVFFRLPKGVKTAEGATLKSWVVDPIGADGLQTQALLTAAE